MRPALMNDKFQIHRCNLLLLPGQNTPKIRPSISLH